MMLARVRRCAIVGLDGALVDVKVDIGNGQPGFTIVGSETQTKCPVDGCGSRMPGGNVGEFAVGKDFLT